MQMWGMYILDVQNQHLKGLDDHNVYRLEETKVALAESGVHACLKAGSAVNMFAL